MPLSYMRYSTPRMYEYVRTYISLVFLCLLGMAVFSLSLIVLNNNTIFKYFKRVFQT